MTNNSYFNKNTSNVKCHAGNFGNVNLCFFHCKLYNELLNLTVFYYKITLNVLSDLSHTDIYHIEGKRSVNQLFFHSTFNVILL